MALRTVIFIVLKIAHLNIYTVQYTAPILTDHII